MRQNVAPVGDCEGGGSSAPVTVVIRTEPNCQNVSGQTDAFGTVPKRELLVNQQLTAWPRSCNVEERSSFRIAVDRFHEEQRDKTGGRVGAGEFDHVGLEHGR